MRHLALALLCLTLACGAAHVRSARTRSGSKQVVPSAATPVRVWTAGDLVSSRQLSLAVSPTYVFLSEAYSISIIDRAAGGASDVRVEGYLPVHRSVFADGRLWVSHGTSPDHSHRISALDPATGALVEVTRTHARACGLRLVDGELWWADDEHVHHARPGGPIETLATAPSGRTFWLECALPLPIDGDAVYLASAPLVAAPDADELVRIPRDGSAIEIIATGAPRPTYLAEAPGGLVIARGPFPGRHGTITLWSVATRAEITLVGALTHRLVALAVHDGWVFWADGNPYSAEAYAITRAPLGGGPSEIFVRGDRRRIDALALSGADAFYLVSGHPPGECEAHYEGCGRGGEMREICTQPDHQLFRATVAP